MRSSYNPSGPVSASASTNRYLHSTFGSPSTTTIAKQTRPDAIPTSSCRCYPHRTAKSPVTWPLLVGTSRPVLRGSSTSSGLAASKTVSGSRACPAAPGVAQPALARSGDLCRGADGHASRLDDGSDVPQADPALPPRTQLLGQISLLQRWLQM